MVSIIYHLCNYFSHLGFIKSGLDPTVSREIAEKIKSVLGGYSWPFEYCILKDETLWAEDVLTDLTTGDPLPCPSIDMMVRYLEKQVGIIVESVYEISQDIEEDQWRYRVIWFGDNYVTVYGCCFPSKDTALLDGIMAALERIEYERRA